MTKDKLSAEVLSRSLVVGNLIAKTSPHAFERELHRKIEASSCFLTGGTGLSIGQATKFVWGYDHDFGSFKVKGKMGNRHKILFDLMAEKGVFTSLTNKRVADIDCWTGGMSLLLCAAGADVYAVDEMYMYLDALQYIASSFGLSLCTYTGLEGKELDYVFMLGCISQQTDILTYLKCAYSAVKKKGGKIVIETLVCDRNDWKIEYCGPSIRHGEFGRREWVWFIPSKYALMEMLKDVGCVDITAHDIEDNRVLVTATRDTCKAAESTRRFDEGGVDNRRLR